MRLHSVILASQLVASTEAIPKYCLNALLQITSTDSWNALHRGIWERERKSSISLVPMFTPIFSSWALTYTVQLIFQELSFFILTEFCSCYCLTYSIFPSSCRLFYRTTMFRRSNCFYAQKHGV